MQGEPKVHRRRGTTLRRLGRAAPSRRHFPSGAGGAAWARSPMASRQISPLLLVDEVPAAVLLPAPFVALGTERLFFSVADRLDAAGADSRRNQSVLHRRGSFVAQGQVIFRGSALVAVPLHRETDGRVLVEELHIAQHRALLIAANVGLVIVEVDILDVLTEQVFIGGRCRRRGRRWWQLRHGDSRGGLLTSASSFRGQVIRSRIRRTHRLRSIGLYCANAVDGYIRGIGSLPRQRGRLPCLNAARICGQRRRRSGRRRWWRRWRRRCFLAAGP